MVEDDDKARSAVHRIASHQFLNFGFNFLVGGGCSAVSKTVIFPFQGFGLPRQAPWWRRGNALSKNITSHFPTIGLSFGFYGSLKRISGNQTDDHFMNFAQNFICGGLAGALTLLLVYPIPASKIELVANILERQQYPNRSFQERVARRYRGFSGSLAVIIPYRAAYFGLFDHLQRKIGKTDDRAKRMALNAMAAVTSVGVGVLLSKPFHVVRRRLQLQLDEPLDKRTYHNMIDCFVKICRHEGAKALYKGVLQEVFVSFSSVLTLVFYVECMSLLGLPVWN